MQPLEAATSIQVIINHEEKRIMQNRHKNRNVFLVALMVAFLTGGASQAADAPSATQKSYYLICGPSASKCPYLNNGARQYCPKTLKKNTFTGAGVHMNYVNQKFYPTLHCFYTNGQHTPQLLIQAADTTFPGNNWSQMPPAGSE